MENDKENNTKNNNSSWVKAGIINGLWMFVFVTTCFHLTSDNGMSLKDVLFGIPFWLIGALGFEYAKTRLTKK